VVERRLRLNEFKTLYKAWKRGIPYWDHLLLGLLYWVEEKIIDYRVKTTVDEAIKEYETLHTVEPTPPVYTETPGEGSLGVSEMRLTAPWYVERSETLDDTGGEE